MVSDKALGAAHVREFINEILEPLGFLAWKPGNKAIWIRSKDGKMRPISQSQDIFELADIAAMRQDAPFLLIQCTTETSQLMSERRLKFNEKIKYINLAATACIVAGRIHGKKEWRIDVLMGHENSWSSKVISVKEKEGFDTIVNNYMG